VIDLYFWPTPNGHKVTMCLKETGGQRACFDRVAPSERGVTATMLHYLRRCV
jgi:hypothetical protein